MSNSFDKLSPLYHEGLDNWGFSPGTRIWMTDGGTKPAHEIEVGDEVFGVAFNKEVVYVPENPSARPTENLKKVWRPVLTTREVLGTRKKIARAWQMTFGPKAQQYETRRVVAGGETKAHVLPVTDEGMPSHRLVDVRTTVENPRTKLMKRRAERVDPEWSKEEGKRMTQPTALSGTPTGDLVTVIPYDAYGGQTGLMKTDERTYERYRYCQAREVIPLMEECELFQFRVTADTVEELGVGEDDPPRCNIIAQTPFDNETKKTSYMSDRSASMIDQLNGHDDVEEFERNWDNFAEEAQKNGPQRNPGEQKQIEATKQGVFWDSVEGEKAEGLQQAYGIEGGFLNGGILFDMPHFDIEE